MRHVLPLLTDLPTIGPGPHPAPGPLDVHVWRHDYGASIGPERISALLALLSPEEHARFARLRDNRRRQHFLVGRALCRQVLSRYAPVPPEEWRFALGSRGKPAVAAPALPSPLWFNLSHTDGVSVCAVTGAGPEIGIDIERIALGRDALEIAEQFFPEKEADIHVIRRWVPDKHMEDNGGNAVHYAVYMAAKRFRDSDHRMFHRDAGYLEGRRVRRSRETRAMARRTDFGKQLISGRWAFAEFNALAELWGAGLPVPYPVQITGTEC